MILASQHFALPRPPDTYEGWPVCWRRFGDHFTGMIGGKWYQCDVVYSARHPMIPIHVVKTLED